MEKTSLVLAGLCLAPAIFISKVHPFVDEASVCIEFFLFELLGKSVTVGSTYPFGRHYTHLFYLPKATVL